jgi:serine/threonine protein kinase
LNDIASGINHIHLNELIHRDLHLGNILCKSSKSYLYIADMGSCKPANYNTSENAKYQQLWYNFVLVRFQELHKVKHRICCFFSFGIIMHEVISGLSPYYDIIHEQLKFVMDLNQGLILKYHN